jgi:hypothetical protein
MISVVKSGSGWSLQDEKGRLHSARIADKARAQRQAAVMNAKLEQIREGFGKKCSHE